MSNLPNLETLSLLARQSLIMRREELGNGIIIGESSGFEVKQGKGYAAISQTPISWEGRQLGSGIIYSVAFKPGDGTGNKGNFSESPLIDKHTPRIKVGSAEMFLAIGTYADDRWYDGANSLTAATFDSSQRQLQVYKRLTSPSFAQGLSQTFPHFDFTFDNHAKPPYGNPHAIIWESDNLIGCSPESIQIGAFLLFPEMDEGLAMVRKTLSGIIS